MVSISMVVSIIFGIIIAALVFGLLWYALQYCEAEFPGGGIFWKFGRIVLILLSVFVLIGILLQFISGQPVFRN